MPGRNGTGPMGFGPATGRGMGPCAVASGNQAGYGMGLGLGCRRGFRGGFGRGFIIGHNKTDKEMLLEQKELLQKRVDIIDERLKSL